MNLKKVLKILALQIPILIFYGSIVLSIAIGMTWGYIVCLFFYLLIFALIKAGVFKIIFEKIKNWEPLYKTIIINNIISLIIGIVIFSTSIIFSNLPADEFAHCYPKPGYYGSWDILSTLVSLSILINSVLYFIITYHLEYFISLKILKEDYESKKIQKTVLWYNFTNFLIPQIYIICVAIGSFLNFDKGYTKCNVPSLNYYFMAIFILVVLTGIVVFVIKKYIKKEETKILLKENSREDINN